MYCYENEDYLKNEIMEQNRHQFIYSYNDAKRELFLNKLDNEYPIKIDCNSPMCIYLNDFSFPKISVIDCALDNNKIDILSNEYLSFTIAVAILEKTRKNVDVDLLNSKITRLLHLINKYDINSGHKKITSFDELILTMNESKSFYKSYYLDYVKTGQTKKSINDISISFLHLESFISQYKRALNNTSYFAIIIDKSDDISLSSTKAINLLIGSRINKDISMKIVVEPGKWDSYIDVNGQYIESIHDYGVVELDDSQKKYIKSLKK